MKKLQASMILCFNDHNVEVLRKKMLHMRLTLYANGAIRLSAPKQASNQQIMSFLDSKSAWLEKSLKRLREKQSRQRPFALEENRLFLWGEKYKLVLHEYGGHAYIKRNENTVELFIPDSSCDPEFYIIQFYARETEVKAAPLLDLWTKRMNLDPVHCSVRAMKSRWGSCTPVTGRIRLNSWLASYIPQCLEYVIVHELCHFFEKNHGPGFYKLMEACLPDWENRRHTLKQGIMQI